MTDATLVLLDEPGAGVNRTLLAEIAHAIRTLNAERGYSFCIIEHDMGFIAELCDPVICMAEGRVLCEGTMAEVRRDPRVLEAYLGAAEKPLVCSLHLAQGWLRRRRHPARRSR
ncbi:MAG: hypothetical protein R3C69_02510 [Geminicoccaceae bacterium]